MVKKGRVGVIGRFKPLHKGGALMLDTLCETSEQVVIGIGSSNKYNLRNPFTAEETEEMLHSYLSTRHKNYEIVHIPDFAHIPEYSDGRKWHDHVHQEYGELDLFVSGNTYVRELMSDVYKVGVPSDLIPKELWIPTKGTVTRLAMAMDESWREMVPKEIADHLTDRRLIDRFKQEFGLATIATLAVDPALLQHETADAEYQHTLER